MDVVALQAAKVNAAQLYARRTSTVVIYGDSITANCGPSLNGSTTGMNSNGYWTWATRRLRHRLRLLNNAGVTGETSAQILARFDSAVAAYKPGVVVVLAGRNDGAIGAAATEANLAAIYAKVANIGAVCVACTLPPYNLPGGTTGQALTDWQTQRAADNQTNHWIKRQALVRPNFLVADFASAVSDLSGNFDFPTCTADGKHPNTAGASRMGRVLASALASIVPNVDFAVATNDEVANIAANPMMLGTGGTVNTGGTGTLAQSWQAGLVGSGGAYTVSQVACTDLPGLNWQQLTVTTAGTGGAQIYQYTDITNSAKTTAAVNDGNLYVATCEFESDAPISGPVYLAGSGTGIYLKLSCFNSGFGTLAAATDLATAGDVYPVEARETSGVMRTPPIQIPSGTVHVQISANLLGVGNLRVRRFDLRRLLSATDA